MTFRLDAEFQPPRLGLVTESKSTICTPTLTKPTAVATIATTANLARRITERAPQHQNAWNLLGITLLALNQLDAAAEALETQIKVSEQHSRVQQFRARLLAASINEDAAVQFRKQLVINPQDHYSHSNLNDAA